MAEVTTAEWRRPEEPEASISGILYQDETNRWIVLLDGSFEKLPRAESGKLIEIPISIAPLEYPLLHGTTSGGKLITLFGCQVVSSGLPGWPGGKTRVRPKIVAYDVHFESEQDFKLTSLAIRYSNLDTWVGISGFEIKFSPSIYPVEIRYSKPEAISADLSDGLSLRIAFSVSGPSSRPGEDLNIVQRAWIEIASSKGHLYQEMLLLATKFSDLVALAVGQPIRPLEMLATCEATARREGPLKRIPIGLVSNSEPIAPELPEVEGRDMLFTLPDIQGRFGDIARTWLAKNDEDIKPLYDLYFGTLRSPSMYVEHRFLNMFQALESYGRRTHVYSPEKQQEREERYARILSAVDQIDRNWIKKRLEDRHKPEASELIRYLTDRLQAKWIIDDESVKLAAKLRNFHTHFDAKAEAKLPPKTGRILCMLNLAVRLRVLCEVALLRITGFSCEEARLLIERTRRLERHLRIETKNTGAEPASTV